MHRIQQVDEISHGMVSAGNNGDINVMHSPKNDHANNLNFRLYTQQPLNVVA